MYNEFYGFSEEPFNVTPDPRFLYQTPDHREALASMLYGINERKGFVSITGEVGTGKTTLIHHLLNNLDEKVKAVFIYRTNITFEELLKEILLELELPLGDQKKASLIRQLNEYLIQRLSRDEVLAIIIDEAQNLSKEVMEELRTLSNLETPKSKLLQIVLVGQPELEAKLNSEELRQLKQRIGIRRQIRPLSLKESRQYIDHRLNLVGSSSSKVFTAEAVSLICRYAQGIPRTINILCDNALLIGYSLFKKKIDASIIKEVLKDMGILTDEEPARPRSQNGEKSRVLPLRTIFYSAFAMLCLVLVIFLGWEYMKITSEKPLPKASISQLMVAQSVVTPTPPPPENKLASEASLSQPKTESKPKKIIAVKEGANLFSLCRKYYNQANTTLVDHILGFNPGITNPHLIRVDQEIEIPEITEASLIIESSDGTCKVYLGTFLRPDSVRQYKDEPALEGREIEVIPWKVSPWETWLRVMVGKFDTREEGLKTIQILREKGLLPSFGGYPKF
jgi:general secretion pathway protein A